MADVRPGQVWKTSDRERIKVDEVSSDTVVGTLSDMTAGTKSVWAGSPGDFEAFELIEDGGQQ